MFAIEKNNKIPTRSNAMYGDVISAILSLQDPGDSFFIPCLDKENQKKAQVGISSKMSYLITRKKVNFRVITRSVVENGVSGIRVWRAY